MTRNEFDKAKENREKHDKACHFLQNVVRKYSESASAKDWVKAAGSFPELRKIFEAALLGQMHELDREFEKMGEMSITKMIEKIEAVGVKVNGI